VDRTAAALPALAQTGPMTPVTRFAHRTAHAASATHGAALTFETLVEGEAAPARLRASEDTLLRVVAGIIRLTVDAEERLLGTGDEAIVPAGAPHSLASAGGEARILSGFRSIRR
jgi:mannose-6-phosphate isomerase-like protein (cupin superfamily)